MVLPVLICLMIGPVTANAQEVEQLPSEPPIEIVADNSDYDLRSGVSRFNDNVTITRGAMTVRADRGTIHQADGRISEIELEGSPSTWEDVLEDGSRLSGESRRIHFNVPANIVTLIGNARIRHAQGEFTGHELIYDLDAESLAGRSEGDDRVRVIIEPDALQERD